VCGIVGLYSNERAVSLDDLQRMNATIVHRGPDDAGAVVDGPAGIGMRRLSIIDLEGGQQPIANESGRIHVVQNGEIYNYRELRRDLELRGHRFRTASDTEVAVHAYEEWGGFEFASRLRGMFAIAIWDADHRELWLVRDRLGIKPLYYAQVPAGFAFGSEVKAILASPIVRPELEPRALERYLAYGTAGPRLSFVKDVCQLGPGESLRLAEGRVEIRPYWQFRFPAEPLKVPETEAVEMLRDRLRAAVRSHLVSDVPVGAFLSGGIDSSALVGMMAQEIGTPLKTFSIGFGEKEFDELPYAKQVADRWQTEHITEVVRPSDAMGILDKLIFHLDDPFADASAIPTWYVSRLASRHVKVVISGDGGDELFAGYTRYATAVNRLWLDRIPLAARRMAASFSVVLPEWWPGKYFLDYAGRDARDRYCFDLGLFPPSLRARLLRPEWRAELLGSEEPMQEARRVMETCGAPERMSECMHLDVVRYLPLDILVKVDRMTMAHSLEARPPLLDHEFVEFVASLPVQMKYSPNGRRKHVFKEAVAALLPDGLIDRRKSGFSVPLQAWFAGPLSSLFRDQVLSDGHCTAYLDPRVIRMLFEENRRGRRDHGIRLWAILVLELWIRRNLSRHGMVESVSCRP